MTALKSLALSLLMGAAVCAMTPATASAAPAKSSPAARFDAEIGAAKAAMMSNPDVALAKARTAGKLAFESVEVINRQTGEIGLVGRTFDIATPRRYVAETLYATPMWDGQGELRLFGRAQFQAGEQPADLLAGAAFNVRF